MLTALVIHTTTLKIYIYIHSIAIVYSLVKHMFRDVAEELEEKLLMMSGTNKNTCSHGNGNYMYDTTTTTTMILLALKFVRLVGELYLSSSSSSSSYVLPNGLAIGGACFLWPTLAQNAAHLPMVHAAAAAAATSAKNSENIFHN